VSYQKMSVHFVTTLNCSDINYIILQLIFTIIISESEVYLLTVDSESDIHDNIIQY
jgi:hypothetical protein